MHNRPEDSKGWAPSRVWRTTPAAIRGGAIATAFDYDKVRDAPLVHGREHTEEEMWDTVMYLYEYTGYTPRAQEVHH